MTDEELIRRTFTLARLGLGTTWPNPLVGSVIVKNGRIIGEGHHRLYGGPHAEIEALNNCTESPEGSTLYVNLEPCCHTQKQTPPCAQRLIKEKIKRVVISNLDPNPLVNGKGVELLRSHGIEVEHGLLSHEGELLNEVFFHVQRHQRPFVHLKLAMTLDGKTALPSGESQWITGPEAREKVHKLRSEHQAVLVGAGTVRQDDPKLNVRLPHYQGPQPYRIVFTESGDLPTGAKLFNDELKNKTIIYTKKDLNFSSIEVRKMNSLKEALADLKERKMISLFLEGGSQLASAFLKENLVDRITLFINPSLMGEGQSVLSDIGVKTLQERHFLKDLSVDYEGTDLMVSGRLT